MIKARGFIVWGGSIVIVLGLFLIFVTAGWPGGAGDPAGVSGSPSHRSRGGSGAVRRSAMRDPRHLVRSKW